VFIFISKKIDCELIKSTTNFQFLQQPKKKQDVFQKNISFSKSVVYCNNDIIINIEPELQVKSNCDSLIISNFNKDRRSMISPMIIT
jgi:hypothetical protein